MCMDGNKATTIATGAAVIVALGGFLFFAIGGINDRIDETNDRITRLEQRIDSKLTDLESRVNARFDRLEDRVFVLPDNNPKHAKP